MDSESSSNLYAGNGKASSSELENLAKQHGKKLQRIEELKKQIEEIKHQLETSDHKEEDISQDKIEAFKDLTDEYNCLRQEYNTLLAGKSGCSEN